MGGSGGRRKKYVKERQGEKGNGIEGRKEGSGGDRKGGREETFFIPKSLSLIFSSWEFCFLHLGFTLPGTDYCV